MKNPLELLSRLAMEQPFRLFVKSLLRALLVSVRTRSFWDVSERPHYLRGILFAAQQAKRERIAEISVIEFGVAGGNGLLALEREAAAVEKELGVAIKVYGFDNGPAGLPQFTGDYRDHPDIWRPGDYPMDVAALKAKLSPRTRLVLGDVRDTVPRFFDDPQVPPVGFIAIDLDLYSSTASALRILDLPQRRVLQHVALYFDDVEMDLCHRFAGELLAIDEFNERNPHIKIDRWRGLKNKRPFPETAWLQRMYMSHDLKAINAMVLDRQPLTL